MNMADDRLVAEVADLLREMDDRQVLAVLTFAVHLRAGGVHPTFFNQIAAALQDRGDEQ